MVTAAALLVIVPEQHGNVFSQDTAAVLDEEANQLAYLKEEENTLLLLLL